MKTILAPFAAWTRANPIRSSLLMCLCCLLGFFLALLAFSGDWGIGPSIMLALAAIVITITWSKKVVSIVMAAILFMQGSSLNAEEPEPPQPGPYVVAIVVVAIIGGIGYFYLKGFCQRKFPRPPARDTNSSPFMAISPASVDDDYAATWVFLGWLSCEGPLEPAGGGDESMKMIELRGVVQRTPNGIEWRISQSHTRLDQSQDLVDAAEYERILLVEHGVAIGRSAGEQHFAMNGVPCTEWDTPIQFSTSDDLRPVVSIGQGAMFDGVMERSQDLVNWQEMGRARVSDGQPIVMTDMTVSGQMFYRFGPVP